jgi:hypothetical protein
MSTSSEDPNRTAAAMFRSVPFCGISRDLEHQLTEHSCDGARNGARGTVFMLRTIQSHSLRAFHHPAEHEHYWISAQRQSVNGAQHPATVRLRSPRAGRHQIRKIWYVVRCVTGRKSAARSGQEEVQSLASPTVIALAAATDSQRARTLTDGKEDSWKTQHQ